MSPIERPEVLIDAQADFRSYIDIYSRNILEKTQGLEMTRVGNSVFVKLHEKILDPSSLFYQYLRLDKSQEVFGKENPLFQRAPIVYENKNPTAVNYFNTRLLLAFFEVQLGLGYSGSQLEKHQQTIKNIINGQPERFIMRSLYNPFTHEDDLGIHYVEGPDKTGGYEEKDWENFLNYSKIQTEKALKIDPENIQGLIKNSEDVEGVLNNLDSAYSNKDAPGKINIKAIRSVSQIVYDILSKVDIISVPIIDCLLDMPYKQGAKITFQSTCGG